jgi:hypothetical protein
MAHLPDHIKGKGAFFLNGSSWNRAIAGKAGDDIICAWDHAFEDNVGFYRLHALLRRGRPPVVR